VEKPFAASLADADRMSAAVARTGTIEENREPENSAANNLRSMALCFASLESTRSGRMEIPGKILQAGPGCSTE